jgi:hypothetical protein
MKEDNPVLDSLFPEGLKRSGKVSYNFQPVNDVTKFKEFPRHIKTLNGRAPFVSMQVLVTIHDARLERDGPLRNIK